MQLITMAHIGEAQSVIDNFKLKKLTPDTYGNEELILIVTGEGPFEAAIKTAAAIAQYKCNNVINLGVAGTLNPEIQKGSIHTIRSIYLVQDLKLQFKTFSSSKEGLDCVTSFERILDPQKVKQLKGVASLVDREAWGVAMAAKSSGVPFTAHKIVSDDAGTIEACELVKEMATQYSQKLALFLRNNLHKIEIESPILDIKGFYFTFSMEHKFNNLLRKISIKKDISIEETYQALPITELLSTNFSPKIRAVKLLTHMDEVLDPIKKLLTEKKAQWTSDFEKNGIRIQSDPNWEDGTVTISLDVNSQIDFNQKLETLKTFDMKPFTDLLSGKIYVE